MLTKDHAKQIARKLEAEIKSGKKAHDLASIYHDGKLIAWFGIRRGSRRDSGHDHIPKSLSFSADKCLGLARCPVSKDDWLSHMKKIGRLG